MTPGLLKRSRNRINIWCLSMMNNDLLDGCDMADSSDDIINLDNASVQLMSEDARRLDARRKIERLLEMKALKEFDEDIEWWYPE